MTTFPFDTSFRFDRDIIGAAFSPDGITFATISESDFHVQNAPNASLVELRDTTKR